VSTRAVEIEELESTKSEKLLAVVLAVFVSIGAVWAYARSDDLARRTFPSPVQTQAEAAASMRLVAASNAANRATRDREQALQQLVLAREAYRTALDAGRTAPALEAAYRTSQGHYREAVARETAARIERHRVEGAATAAERSFSARADRANDRQAVLAFGLRLGLTAGLLVLGYLVVARLRRRESRALLLGFAIVASAVLLAIVFAGDYVTDYVDPLDLGPLVLSLFGVATTIAAFAVLQRYLAKRTPARRVRKGECPFCGYPVRAGGPHCEACGREVVAPCGTCSAERRVGVAHCAACGAA
jgi:hypothetical protein